MHIKYCCGWVALILLTACGGGSKSSMDEDRLSTVNVTQCDDVNPAEIGFEIESTRVIPLETSGECLVGYVSGLAHYDGDWYVESGGQNLFRFDSQGNFVCSYGGMGNGPGEYDRINTFAVYNGKVYIISGNLDKICVYSVDGQWISDSGGVECLKFATSVTEVGDGKFIVANNISFNPDCPLYGLWSVETPTTLKPLIDSPYSSSGSYQWSVCPVSQCNDDIYALSPLSGDILAYDTEQMKLDRFITFNGLTPEMSERPESYSDALTGILKNGGNPIMTLCASERFLICGLLRGSLFWNIEENRGAKMSETEYNWREGEYPLIPLTLRLSDGNDIVAVAPADDYLTRCGDNIVSNREINAESNPLIVVYHMASSTK